MKKIIKYLALGLLVGFLLYMGAKILAAHEGYTNLGYSTVPLLWTAGNEKHPKDNYAREDILLNDSYPLKWRNQVNMKDQWRKWWHYPSFEVGSYEQITNNIRWPNNPDIATCTPEEFCGALYHKQQYKSNIYEPIAPLPVCAGDNTTRVGYFFTAPNRLPYESSLPNILY